jgi:predicted ATPase/class 3 adenylate cyclase
MHRNQIQQTLHTLMPTSLAAKIEAAAVEIVGERRKVTVLFLDIADFSAITHALDSEDVYLLIDEAMRLLAEVVYKYEGAIDKYTGNGLIALFGAPVTHENDPERAVRAALEMQTVLQPLQDRIRREYDLAFQARIGINTGLVIAGQVGGDLHMEYTVVGDTVNLASRLQAAAEPGSILVSFATYQHTRPLFDYETLPPLVIKGEPQPIRAFRPLGLQTKPKRVRGLPGLEVPMIGRQDALARLEHALSEIRHQRRSQIVLITGEAGVGKSRLVAEYRKSETASNANFYQGSCLAYARSKPFWLLANLLRDMMRLSETASVEAQCETLQAYLDRLGLDKDDVASYLVNLLELEQADTTPEINLWYFNNTALKRSIHAALRQVFLAEARLTPTVLIFDDLHWIDPASRDFMEHLIQTVDDVPLMLVLIAREAEQEITIHPLIAAAEQYHEQWIDIHLEPLSEVEGQLLVDQLLEPVTDEAHALKRRIAERAAGNPFYAEEIIRMLVDQDGLTRENKTWRVTSRADELLQEIPGTLHGLILARFDRLPTGPRRMLQKAAVISTTFGDSFPLSLLQESDYTSHETVAEQLDELQVQQFLITSPFGSQRGYAFRHALIQEAIYGTLLKRDRKNIHAQAAQAIEQGKFYTPDEQSEALAYHYAESSNPSKAIPYLIAAAESAAQRCADEIAIQHYRRALTLIQALPPQTQATDLSDQQLVRAQIGLGQALKFTGEYSQASQTLDEALKNLMHQSLRVDSSSLLPSLVHALRELADIRVREGSPEQAVGHLQAGLNALGTRGAQEHPDLWRLLMDRLAWVRFRQGQLEEAFALASSATLDLEATKGDDPMVLASLYNTLGGIFWQWGDLSQASSYVERGLELYHGVGYAWGAANAYTNLGILSYVQGKWPEALDSFTRSDTIRRKIGYAPTLAHNLNNLGTLRIAMGDHDQAQEELETSLTISQRLGDDFSIAQAHLGLGHLAVIQSRFEEAATHIETALRLSDAAGEAHQRVQARWLLALIQTEQGDVQAGLKSAEQALQMAQTDGLTEAEADCRRVLGVLCARVGNYRRAEALLQEAVALCLSLNAPYNQGLALLELGRLYRRQADDPVETDDARLEWRAKTQTSLDKAIEKFECLGAAYDLELAQAEMAGLQTKSPPSRPGTGQPEGAWHTATILWLNLSPPPDADAEAIFETTALIVPALTAIAQEYKGQIVRRQDGLTVVFGAPMAYEDDAERAIQTAWRMVEHLKMSVHQAEAPPTFTVGVSQGDVVAGHVGSRFHTEFVVRGEPVRVAQRVAESVPPGKIWVTDLVRAASERVFTYEPAPVSAAVSLADLSLWELTGWRVQPRPARGLPDLKAKLIGRDGALQGMIDLSRNLQQGIGGLIWIEGAPGIGKSRLIREFAASIKATGNLVWSGRSFPQKSGHAFALFSDLLTEAFNLQPADTSDQAHTKIDQTIQTWSVGAQATKPYLKALLGLEPDGQAGQRLASLEPEQLRQQIFVALRRLLKSLAQERPLVILLDDLHWIDPVSAELLLFLVTMVAKDPILFVCAQRRQGSDSPNDRLVRSQSLLPDQTVHIQLERLSTADSETLLRELLPQTALPDPLHTTILEQSEGNPYFIEEFIRMLIEQDYLQHRQGRWEINDDLNLGDIPFPSSLETLIRSRIDALPPELKQLIECAAVIGAPFETSLLESIPGLSDVKAGLGRLESRLLIHRGIEAEQWAFNHSMIETVVYSAMLRAKRKTLHRQIAQALEARWAGAEADHAEELAYHFTQADESAQAFIYLVTAGERAAAQYANEEAVGYFEQAAQQLSVYSAATDNLRWRLSAGLGDAYRALGQYADSKSVLEIGLSLVESEGLSDRLRAGLYRRLGETSRMQGAMDVAQEHFTTALAILDPPADRETKTEAARILTGIAWVHFLQGRFDQAREACEASLEYAQSADELNALARAENLLGGVYLRQNEWAAASHHTTRAMILREQTGYTWGVASTLSNLGVLSVRAGQWDKARSFFERSLALRQEMGDVEGMALLHNNLAMLVLDQGDLDLAEHHFRESLEVAEPFKIGFHTANSKMGLARALLKKGESEAAQEILVAGLAQAEAIGSQNIVAEAYRVQAEILLERPALREALVAAERAVSLAADTGDRSLEAAAWRVLSAIELQREDVQAAHEALAQARQVLVDVTDEIESGRVAAQVGQIHLYEGQFTQAKADLQIAKKIFARLGANLDLQRVEEMSKRL